MSYKAQFLHIVKGAPKVSHCQLQGHGLLELQRSG
jgi:hypothetical protein